MGPYCLEPDEEGEFSFRSRGDWLGCYVLRPPPLLLRGSNKHDFLWKDDQVGFESCAESWEKVEDDH